MAKQEDWEVVPMENAEQLLHSLSSVPWLKAAALTDALPYIKAQHSYFQEITWTLGVLVPFPAASKFLPVLPCVEPG